MADETTTTHETRAPSETIVIRDTQPSSGGAGWVIAIILIVGLIAGFWFFSQTNTSEVAKDNAISNAADNVGAAAQDVGTAAKDASEKLDTQ